MEAGLSNNIACIIQARISSSRLPGKIALDLYGKTILERVIEQCITVQDNIDLIIATSTDSSDNITAEIGKSAGVDVYRGSLLDVRSRYLNAGKGYWLRFSDAGTNTVSGESFTSIAVSLSEGWNLITGPSFTAVIDDSDGIVIAGTLYGYNSAYFNVNELEPGSGYWVRANASGEVMLIAR